MRTTWGMVGCMMAAMAWGALPARGAQTVHEDALMTAGGLAGLFSEYESESALGSSPDAQQYADGTKAIREGRWADAVKIFDAVARQAGDHAAGALYWEAYAQNKMGQPDKAIGTCVTMRTAWAKSGWRDDCQALEIEIRASTGQPAQPKADQSDELKLLALASLMGSDPEKATAQIKEIVEGDSSERLKEGAVFILGQQVPDATYPQIVRISYLEGDVRVARASENEKSSKPAWETAVMNLPLNEGDSVVTGKDGRVEIEFEDASTMYLAENSVLNCIDMHTTGGVPHTELALVSGTVTTHLDSLMGGETFLLRTPTENILTRYPQKSNLRLTSYLDGMSVTSLSGGTLNVTGSAKVDLASGKTMFFSDGHSVTTLEATGKTENFEAFDAWVADRYSARTSATAEMMKDAGLSKPIPGLAEMQGKGHFFECPPYGMCWQPDAPQARAVLSAPPVPPPTPKTANPMAGGPTAGGPGQQYPANWFPCMGQWYPGMAWRGVYPAGYLGNPGAFYFGVDPYAWAVCHSGAWVPRDDGYAWVPGGRLHHHCPVHWIKFGHTTGLVPIHPRDVNGKPPLNRDHGLVPIKGRDGMKLTPIRVEPGKPVEVLKSAPREFRNPSQPSLPRADAPRMMAFSMRENAKAGIPAHAAIPMSFNQHQGFMTSQSVVQGGRPVAINVPVGRVGGGPSLPLGGGFAGGRAGGAGFGAVGVSHGGGFSSAHAGGGGGGSFSGGGHAGGGGTVSSAGTTSVSTPSASSTAASSGGSHK